MIHSGQINKSIQYIAQLEKEMLDFKRKLENSLPSIPTILADEIECNIFLKAKDVESFSKLRDLKDNF